MNEKLYKMMNWPEIEAIIYSEEDDPHRLLGPHEAGNATVVQAFHPGAVSVVLHREKGKDYEMEMEDENGYFAVLIPEKKIGDYTYRVTYADGQTQEKQDPYRFGPVITKEDTAKFNAGIHYEAYRILGAHLMTLDKTQGVHFAVWAPNAVRVSVVTGAPPRQEEPPRPDRAEEKGDALDELVAFGEQFDNIVIQ